MKQVSKFSIKIFLMILLLVIFPLITVNLLGQKRLEETLQEKLSDNIIENISRNQSYINESLMDMAYYSNSFIHDDELRKRIASEMYSQYDNSLYFNRIISRVSIENPTYIRNSAKIIIFDNFGRIYSNWSLNYNDYQFILQEEWVKESKEREGHAVWSLFQPSYIEEEKGKKYISLARTILENKTSGKEIGTLIISISQDEMSKLMMQYAYQDDQACICIDKGDILLTSSGNVIEESTMKQIYKKTSGETSGKLKEKINGKEYLISYSTFPSPWKFGDQEMKLFHFTDYRPIKEQVESAVREIRIVTYCLLILMIIVCFFLSRRIVSPIVLLTNKMKKYTLEEEITGLDLKRRDEIGSLNRGFAQMVEDLHKLFQKLHEENEIKEKYHYESLRAQLNPHFLFNTLNTIRWMAMIRKANNIVDAIDAVSSILRYSMSREEGLVFLEDEFQNIQDYAYIHSLRYAEIIHLQINVEERYLRYKTLKFILQPIVENAVIHGLDETKQSLSIIVDVWQIKDTLYISVKDNGVGIKTDVIEDFEEKKYQKTKASRLTGIGLTNVDSYIRIRFGDQYGIHLEKAEEGGTIVLFRIPVILDETTI